MSRRAVFLDRDGTLVHARHYPSRPEELVLYDGIVDRLAELKAAGLALVMITNQSGIARGLFSTDALDRMHGYLRGQLEPVGADLDGVYFCPHHPEGCVAEFAIACDCRKPQPGMLLRAAVDLDLDLERSWFLGDILDDVEAGNRAGCRTILIDLGTESTPTEPARTPTFVARSTAHALDIVRFEAGLGPPVDLRYRPPDWLEPSTSPELAVAAGGGRS
jgi:D-glycero-D-manno-heptose 1,7-bisphosphate phosphatase